MGVGLIIIIMLLLVVVKWLVSGLVSSMTRKRWQKSFQNKQKTEKEKRLQMLLMSGVSIFQVTFDRVKK